MASYSQYLDLSLDDSSQRAGPADKATQLEPTPRPAAPSADPSPPGPLAPPVVRSTPPELPQTTVKETDTTDDVTAGTEEEMEQGFDDDEHFPLQSSLYPVESLNHEPSHSTAPNSFVNSFVKANDSMNRAHLLSKFLGSYELSNHFFQLILSQFELKNCIDVLGEQAPDLGLKTDAGSVDLATGLLMQARREIGLTPTYPALPSAEEVEANPPGRTFTEEEKAVQRLEYDIDKVSKMLKQIETARKDFVDIDDRYAPYRESLMGKMPDLLRSLKEELEEVTAKMNASAPPLEPRRQSDGEPREEKQEGEDDGGTRPLATAGGGNDDKDGAELQGVDEEEAAAGAGTLLAREDDEIEEEAPDKAVVKSTAEVVVLDTLDDRIEDPGAVPAAVAGSGGNGGARMSGESGDPDCVVASAEAADDLIEETPKEERQGEEAELAGAEAATAVAASGGDDPTAALTAAAAAAEKVDGDAPEAAGPAEEPVVVRETQEEADRNVADIPEASVSFMDFVEDQGLRQKQEAPNRSVRAGAAPEAEPRVVETDDQPGETAETAAGKESAGAGSGGSALSESFNDLGRGKRSKARPSKFAGFAVFSQYDQPHPQHPPKGEGGKEEEDDGGDADNDDEGREEEALGNEMSGVGPPPASAWVDPSAGPSPSPGFVPPTMPQEADEEAGEEKGGRELELESKVAALEAENRRLSRQSAEFHRQIHQLTERMEKMEKAAASPKAAKEAVVDVADEAVLGEPVALVPQPSSPKRRTSPRRGAGALQRASKRLKTATTAAGRARGPSLASPSDHGAGSRARAAAKPSVYNIALSGMRSKEKERSLTQAAKIGVEITASPKEWNDAITHLVTPRLGRSEKTLAGMAAGAFVLRETWLADSGREKKLLSEAKYFAESTDEALVARQAAALWRRHFEKTKVGAFHGMTCVFHRDCARVIPSRDTLERIFRAGGGTVMAAEELSGRRQGRRSSRHALELAVVPDPKKMLRSQEEGDDLVLQCIASGIPLTTDAFLIEWLAFPHKNLTGLVHKTATSGGSLPSSWRKKIECRCSE